MKKIKNIILLFAIVALCLFPLVSCSCNKQIYDFNYEYTRAYIKVGEEWIDIPISKWCDYEGEQIQITLIDGSVILTSSYNCILYKGNLPKKE